MPIYANDTPKRLAPLPKPVAHTPPPPPPPPPVPQQVQITVDNAQTLQMIQQQNQMIAAQDAKIAQTNQILRELIAQLEPGKSFSVEVTEWTALGRIKSLKITKE